MSGREVRKGQALLKKSAPVYLERQQVEPRLQSVAKFFRGSSSGLSPHEALEKDERVEYFRGKRFVEAALKAKSKKFALWNVPETEDEAIELGQELVDNGFIHRVRMTQLKKPTKFEPYPAKEQIFGKKDDKEDMYYVWDYITPWQQYRNMILLALVIVGIFAGATIRIWPNWMRQVLLYSAMGILALYFALFVVRLVIYGVCWILRIYPGYWLFPNLFLSDSITGSFLPVWGTGEEGKKERKSKAQALDAAVTDAASGKAKKGKAAESEADKAATGTEASAGSSGQVDAGDAPEIDHEKAGGAESAAENHEKAQ